MVSRVSNPKIIIAELQIPIHTEVEEGIELTNNLAERTLRFGVMWRKRSQGGRGDTSGFCPCAIPVSSNASPPSVSLWMRSLLILRDKNLTLNG